MRTRSIVVSSLLVLALAGAARAGSIPVTCRTPRASASPAGCDTLTVFINLSFEPSIDAQPIRQAAEAETSAIWSPYGVRIVWSEDDAPGALRLDAVVTSANDTAASAAASVLGHAVVGRAFVAARPDLEPIHVSLDAIETLIGDRLDQPRKRHVDELATALGRVLAHEIGHVLLGEPAYHDVHGLMRPLFHSAEIVRPERTRFALADASILRLRSRIQALKELETVRD